MIAKTSELFSMSQIPLPSKDCAFGQQGYLNEVGCS